MKRITSKLLLGLSLFCSLSLSPSLTQARHSKLPTNPLNVKAVLVNTVESGAITPVMGVTQENLYVQKSVSKS